jgi:tetratricopeptide (TPR) repeat protein
MISRSPTFLARGAVRGLFGIPAIAFALCGAPAVAQAQFMTLGGAVAESDLLYLSGDQRLALEILEEYLATDPTDVDALWRAARAGVVIGIGEEGSRAQNRWLDPAIDRGRRAIELDPDDIDGRYWYGVAAGRRAMNAAPSYAVELVQILYEEAHAILAVDSLHGGAQNMLGKMNYEIMNVSRVKRLIARTFMGNRALGDTSWENAEYYLGRAVRSWPEYVLFHFDLAQLYKRRGRRDEAIEEYQAVLALPPVHPTDRRLQTQALEQLAEWEVVVTSGVAATTGSTRENHAER